MISQTPKEKRFIKRTEHNLTLSRINTHNEREKIIPEARLEIKFICL